MATNALYYEISQLTYSNEHENCKLHIFSVKNLQEIFNTFFSKHFLIFLISSDDPCSIFQILTAIITFPFFKRMYC